MSNNRQPPLYGRPPYATDEDDAVYDQVQQPQARPRQRQPEQGPNGGRDSMYQACVASSFLLGEFLMLTLNWEQMGQLPPHG